MNKNEKSNNSANNGNPTSITETGQQSICPDVVKIFIMERILSR